MWSFISDWSVDHLETFQYVHLLSGVFFYLSSAVNPVLYNLMSTRFREMFKEVMCHWPPRGHSFSVTRLTLRSTLSDTANAANATAITTAATASLGPGPCPPADGLPVVEGEVEGSLFGEKEDETSFAC
ncbi:hypothetical protein NHX12_033604 [Muraenolepis orangiensis]|uniref:Uncharacterized protein n=1 Tax=Muraenolepis orangiensis TaxID=630683 RepID=A0A9Q0E487_9TELE|nr:hypothetical protein NHX12_033604 [Muraenolepis orangiensis]